MTLRGHMQNGVVVLDDQQNLPDGTEVSVEVHDPPAAGKYPKGSAEALLQNRQEYQWVGPAGELERLTAEVQEMREEDLRLTLSQPELTLDDADRQ
jgi:hypothetical protein